MPLPIIQSTEVGKKLTKPQEKRLVLEAKYERAWLLNPDQFNPERSILEKERISKSWMMLDPLLSKSCKVADLACGSGAFTQGLLRRGHQVDAVDIASNALKRFDPHPNLRTFQQAVPRTTLNDFDYDIVLALDLIAELHQDDQRLFTSEVQRLMKRDGRALLSSPLDYKTHEPLRFFLSLLSFEFKVEALILAHHALYLSYFKIESEWLMKGLEKVTRFFSPDAGVSHVIALVSKKSIR